MRLGRVVEADREGQGFGLVFGVTRAVGGC